MIQLPCTGASLMELIPQRSPIVMIDVFYGIENEVSHSGLTILSTNIFIDNKQFAEPGLIEHIAQSAAARIGYIFKLKEERVPIGFIGSVDKLKINRLPVVDEVLDTRICVLQEIFGITLIQADVFVGQELIASCKMKIFLENEAKN